MKNAMRSMIFGMIGAMMMGLCACGGNAAKEPTASVENTASSEQTVVSEPSVSSYVSQEETLPSDTEALERLAGVWYVDGDPAAAHLVITADGRFTAYYASGAVEQEGYVLHERNDPQAQTDYTYRLYTDEGKVYMAFIDLEMEPFEEFETWNGGGLRFVRVIE